MIIYTLHFYFSPNIHIILTLLFNLNNEMSFNCIKNIITFSIYKAPESIVAKHYLNTLYYIYK